MLLRTLCVFGTRPEAIKMAPLALSMARDSRFEARVCVTGQHREMLDQVLSLFQLAPDYDLQIMKPGQDLTSITTAVMQGLAGVFDEFAPDLVLVHGDTTTALASSLAAFYRRIPVAHVEAGLRTGNMHSPWPEEANRRLIAPLASIHFAPTESAKCNLLAEGIDADCVHVTGNTVIDALRMTVAALELGNNQSVYAERFSFLRNGHRLVLVTGHRRENFGRGLEQICQALRCAAELFPDVDFVYPVHLNPAVYEPVHRLLGGICNLHLLEPLDYLPFVYLMNRSYMVLTDSGGIQEEAPALGKPVLLMRENTERPEAVAEGTVRLVGASAASICEHLNELLSSPLAYERMSRAHNPYGRGDSCSRIIEIIWEWSQRNNEF